MARLARALVLVAAIVGCNQTTIQTPTRSLDRPSDVALICATWLPTLKTVVLPLDACDPVAASPVLKGPDGTQNIVQLFVLSANTGRGELAVNTTGSAGQPCDLTNPLPCATADQLATLGILPDVRVPAPPGTLCTPTTGGDQTKTVCAYRFGAAPTTGYIYASPRIIDLDPATPGYGFVPLGQLPEHLRTTADGCRAVSANAGSCDLSVVDVPQMMAIPGDNVSPPFLSTLVSHVVPRIHGVPLGASPTWVEISPGTTMAGAATDPSLVDGTGAPVARAIPTSCNSAPYRALVAFPMCELIAEVDLTSGELTQALKVTRDGAHVVRDLRSIHCPSECGATDGGTPAGPTVDAALPADAGSGPAQLLPQTQALPHALAIAPQVDKRNVHSSTLFVADASSARITVVPLEANQTFGAPRSIVLDGPAGGVDTLRVSDWIDLPPARGVADTFVQKKMRYLYAIARDRSVRVLDADALIECETNPDPAALADDPDLKSVFDTALNPGAPDPGAMAQALSCLPVGSYPRDPLALTPGILLPGGALPKDVAFVHVDRPPAVATVNSVTASAPGVAVGDFAWILGSRGSAYAVTIADQCPQPNDPNWIMSLQQCDPRSIPTSLDKATTNANADAPHLTALQFMPNRIRNGLPLYKAPTAWTDPAAGWPRPNDRPATTVNGSTLDPGDDSHANLCYLAENTRGCLGEPLSIDSAPGAGPRPDFVHFTDPMLAPPQTWSFSWEGLITLRASGSITEPIPRPGAPPDPPDGRHLVDPGAGFCGLDVHPGDKVFLDGCTDDTSCGVDQQCFHDPASLDPIHGLCVPRAQAPFSRVSLGECSPWTFALLRYRVKAVTQDGVMLDELPEPEDPIDRARRSSSVHDDCKSDDECAKWPAHEFTPDGQPVDLPTRCLPDRVRLGKLSCRRPLLDYACATDSDCALVFVPGLSPDGQSVDLPTRCLPDGLAPGSRSCIRACDRESKGLDALCGPGYVCWPSIHAAGGATEEKARCLRAPLPPSDAAHQNLCFGGQRTYEVHVGQGFTVLGSVSALDPRVGVDPVTHACIPPPPGSSRRLLARRVDLDAPMCPPDVDQANWLGPITSTNSNACRLVPPAGDTQEKAYLRYQNPILSLVITIPERRIFDNQGTASSLDAGTALPDGGPLSASITRVPDESTVIAFTLIGGYAPFTSSLGPDVLAQQPRSVVVSTDHSTFFIADEGRQSTPSGLRGQIIRFYGTTMASDTSFQIR